MGEKIYLLNLRTTHYVILIQQVVTSKNNRNSDYKSNSQEITAIFGVDHLVMPMCRQSAKTRPGADCGSDHEILIAKFRLKLQKVGEATRPFRYDLNQTCYDYTVEVRNRFKGLDLI